MSSAAQSRRCMEVVARLSVGAGHQRGTTRQLCGGRQHVMHAQKKPGRQCAPPWPVRSDRSFRIVQTMILLSVRFVLSSTYVRQILQLEAIRRWQVTLLDTAQENDLAGDDLGA